MSATAPVLDVIIGCDCDPDRPGYGGVRHDSTAPLTWRGVEEGVPRLREIADCVVDDFGNPARITWCIRSDLQMRDIYGDCAWPAAEFADLWRDLEASGDELAWHPHVWRWNDGARCWYQEIEDVDWIAECLSEGHSGFSRHLGHVPCTSRSGWEFHNNATMDGIRELGVRVDFSAIPGRHTPGCADRWGSRFNCHVDWRGTPETPYVPSPDDYRRPSGEGAPDELWELPMSVLHSGWLRFARIARKVCSGRREALGEIISRRSPQSCAAGGNKLYITMPPLLFSRLTEQQLQRARESGYAVLVTALHPDEVCGAERSIAALHHPRHVRTNLRDLVVRARRSGVQLRFTTPGAMSGINGTRPAIDIMEMQLS